MGKTGPNGTPCWFANLCYSVSAFCKPQRPRGVVSCTIGTLQILAWSLFKSPSGVNCERCQIPQTRFKATEHRDTGPPKVTVHPWKVSAVPLSSHGQGDGKHSPTVPESHCPQPGHNRWQGGHKPWELGL